MLYILRAFNEIATFIFSFLPLCFFFLIESDSQRCSYLKTRSFERREKNLLNSNYLNGTLAETNSSIRNFLINNISLCKMSS